MKTITVKMVRKFNPCYDPTTLEGIDENTKMTLLEAMDLKSIPDKDKAWLASNFMTETQCRVFAIWCAKRCKTNVQETKEYIKAIEGYYLKKTVSKEELEAARRAAVMAANWSACCAADSSAFCVAESAAFCAEYRAAYWAADNAAHWAGDGAKERRAQVNKIKRMLKEESVSCGKK